MKKGRQNGKILSPDEIATFAAQVAMLLRAGVPLADGMAILEQDTADPAGQSLLREIGDMLGQGMPFFMALEQAGCMPQYALRMVEIGEQSGKLDEVLSSLADYYEQEQSLKQSIKSAVTYPAMLVLMLLVVMGVLVVKVMPVFEKVYEQLGSELSGFSAGAVAFGRSFQAFALPAVAAVLLAVLLAVWVNKRTGGRAADSFAASFFLTKGIYEQVAAGRFASAMALMLSSGLNVDTSLDMAHRLVGSELLKKRIDDCRHRLAQGASFADALQQAQLFSGVNAQMVAVGIRTGATDTVMARVAGRYEQSSGEAIAHLISVIEPTLVAVMSVMVGALLLSVMLPLLGIMTSFG